MMTLDRQTEDARIGRLIRTLREARGWTIRELSIRWFGKPSGESRVSRIESGKESIKKLDDVYRLSSIFRVPVAYFTGGPEALEGPVSPELAEVLIDLSEDEQRAIAEVIARLRRRPS